MGAPNATSPPRASLETAKKNAPGVISRAKIMYTAILAAVATFTSPPITMAAFLLLIEAADAAQTAKSTTGAKGSAAARNTKITPLWNAMHLLRIYLQGMVDVLDYASGVNLINQAGLVVGGVGTHVKVLFVAKLDAVAGVVHLELNAKAFVGVTRKRVVFYWQMSSDGGKTWTSLPSTGYAQTELASPGPGAYLFRASARVGETVVDWTPPFPLTIH